MHWYLPKSSGCAPGVESGCDRRLRRGFSLVELLVVIAVIGMLLAIMLPSLRRSMQHAAKTVCMHQLHEIDQALTAYRFDNGGSLPCTDPDRETSGDAAHEAAWFGKLFPRYMQDLSTLRCPSDPYPWAQSNLESALDEQSDPANVSSYGMNEVIRLGGFCNVERYPPRNPSETILLADMGPDQAAGAPDSQPQPVPFRQGGRLRWDDNYHPGTSGLQQSWLTQRHLGSINVLTIGGGVSTVRTREIVQERIRSYYGNCAAGGCPLCTDLSIAHYSFAAKRIYWWTGPLPNRYDVGASE